MTESEREARERKVWKQEKPACTCTPQNPKHREGWQCVTQEQLQAWLAVMSQLPGDTPMPKEPRDLKRACWLWVQFSQHPEAKRLSGRADLGLDRWDDAAGMTELQKGMFP